MVVPQFNHFHNQMISRGVETTNNRRRSSPPPKDKDRLALKLHASGGSETAVGLLVNSVFKVFGDTKLRSISETQNGGQSPAADSAVTGRRPPFLGPKKRPCFQAQKWLQQLRIYRASFESGNHFKRDAQSCLGGWQREQ